MRKFILFFLAAIVLFGCDDNTDVAPRGSLSISVTSDRHASNGRSNESEVPAYIIVTIEDDEGVVVASQASLCLYSFGESGDFFSESLSLANGTYNIMQFLVLNNDFEIIYAAPLEGSEMATMVNDPLPITFDIAPNEATALTIQVIEVTSPEDFGYGTFGFEIVDGRGIDVSFLLSTLPFFETEGFDSVILILEKNQQYITRKLTMISPVEAVVNLPGNVIDFDGSSWNIIIKAYHESIDDVPEIMHTIEYMATTSLNIPDGTREIFIRQDELTIYALEYLHHPIVWQTFSDLRDETGYYKLFFSNDFCAPQFSYNILKPGVGYVAAQKSWRNAAPSAEGLYLEQLGDPFIPTDTYHHNFEIPCAEIVTGDYEEDPSSCPSMLFQLITETEFLTCYVVWQHWEDPYDPQWGRTGKLFAAGGFFKVIRK
jgi:hypothetical protein